MVLAFRYFLIYLQEHDEANKINVWYSSQGSLKNLTRPYLYADFVTSFIAFARYPTLPVVTPAILHISTIIHEKYWSVETWERGREGGRKLTLFDHCESNRYEIHLSNDQPVRVSFHYSKTCQSVCKTRNIVHNIS